MGTTQHARAWPDCSCLSIGWYKWRLWLLINVSAGSGSTQVAIKWINKWPAGCPLCPPCPFACPERSTTVVNVPDTPRLSHWTRLTCVTNRILQKWWSVTSVAKSEKTLQLLSCFLRSCAPGGEHLLPCCEAAQAALRRPLCDEEVPSLAHSHVRALSWKWLFQPQSSLWTTRALDDTLTAALWEALSHPAKLLPNSWPSETVNFAVLRH